MAKRVGANEMERQQIIVALRSGKKYAEATAPWRAIVEEEWFANNEAHLLDVAKHGEQKPSDAAISGPPPEIPRSIVEGAKSAAPVKK